MAFPLSNNQKASKAIQASEARSRQQAALSASLAKKAALADSITDYQPLDTDLTAIAAITPTDGDFIQRVSGVWAKRTASQTKTALSLAKADVGLGSVNNTADADKPVSTATGAALDGKLNTWVAAPASASSTGTAGQIAYASGFLYICVSTDTWERTTLSTW